MYGNKFSQLTTHRTWFKIKLFMQCLRHFYDLLRVIKVAPPNFVHSIRVCTNILTFLRLYSYTRFVFKRPCDILVLCEFIFEKKNLNQRKKKALVAWRLLNVCFTNHPHRSKPYNLTKNVDEEKTLEYCFEPCGCHYCYYF